MGQESKTNDAPVPKLLIDRPSDFKFHAAYLIYSQAWDEKPSQEVRTKLNEIMASLSKGEIDYQSFYKRVNQYRVEFNPEHYSGGGRARIETQRKREWRRREAKDARNSRYRR